MLEFLAERRSSRKFILLLLTYEVVRYDSLQRQKTRLTIVLYCIVLKFLFASIVVLSSISLKFNVFSRDSSDLLGLLVNFSKHRNFVPFFIWYMTLRSTPTV